MSAERGRRDYALEVPPRGWGVIAPTWYLRTRLRWAREAIARIERQLADEFGLLETAPMHQELEALIAERDTLSKRLAARA